MKKNSLHGYWYGYVVALLLSAQLSAAVPAYPGMSLRPDIRLTDEELHAAAKKALARVGTYTAVIRTIGQLGVVAGDAITRAVAGRGVVSDRSWQHNTIAALIASGCLDASLRAALNKDPSLIDALLRGIAWGAVFFETHSYAGYGENMLLGLIGSLAYFGESKLVGLLVKHLGPIENIGGDLNKVQLERSFLRVLGFALCFLANATVMFAVGHAMREEKNAISSDLRDALGYFVVLPLIYELFIESVGVFVYDNVREVLGNGVLGAPAGAGEQGT